MRRFSSTVGVQRLGPNSCRLEMSLFMQPNICVPFGVRHIVGGQVRKQLHGVLTRVRDTLGENNNEEGTPSTLSTSAPAAKAATAPATFSAPPAAALLQQWGSSSSFLHQPMLPMLFRQPLLLPHLNSIHNSWSNNSSSNGGSSKDTAAATTATASTRMPSLLADVLRGVMLQVQPLVVGVADTAPPPPPRAVR